MGAIVNLLKMLGEFLPLWAIGLIAAALLVWLGPGWLKNIKVKQVRERVRRRVRASEDERRARDVGALAHDLWTRRVRTLGLSENFFLR